MAIQKIAKGRKQKTNKKYKPKEKNYSCAGDSVPECKIDMLKDKITVYVESVHHRHFVEASHFHHADQWRRFVKH